MLELSPALNDLEVCVDDSFSPDLIDSCLKELANRGISLDDFEAVITSGVLSPPVEAYEGDQRLGTVAELYQCLEEPDHAQLKNYYRHVIQRLREEQPDLIEKYF